MKIFFVIMSVGIAVTVACTVQKSAGSEPLPANPVISSSSPAVSADRQERIPCALTIAAAPTFEGLKPGMTTDEILALFPGSKDDPDLRTELARPPSRFGTLSFVLRPSKYEGKEKLSEVSQISFSLLDGRVSNFTVSYNGPEWPHVDKFVEKIVDGTNLPAVDQWAAYVGLDNQMKTLTCSDFEVRVFAGGQGGNLNYVMMQDIEADKKLKERRAKARAAATPSPER